ncbi:MAG: hypothetical protein PHT69_02385 [Bacteroidales bacterium]|nr:hypothetical protein [Bacteroidales bacterium]
MKNTAELNINLKIALGEDKQTPTSSLEIYAKIDGEQKYYQKKVPFTSNVNEFLEEIHDAIKVIEKDGRFGC